ncbi:MAG TPA: hypothetical protein DCE42_25870 [Myxococcales bacterium]|nr:hypothetical protein [Deltaproteobacteria bacterium]HAA58218.1 hypothetical protein [Myxococcales bacterium]|tara:strand:+ start:356 stop:1336 length:981 start_codon:yes stop_codon:yes gene_type:complete
MYRKSLWMGLFFLFASLFLAGCAATTGLHPNVIVLLLVMGVGAYLQVHTTGCVNPMVVQDGGTEASKDAGGTDKQVKEEAPDGTWESCCQNGKISTCFCPAGASCNYGLYQDCGSYCTPPGQSCEPTLPDNQVKDETTTDKQTKDETTTDKQTKEETPDGTWEACCKDGKVSTCFCPAGASCNYGQFQNCGSYCVLPGQSCEPVQDAGPKEMAPEPKPEPEPVIEKQQPDGTWQQCCQNGMITTCFCPTGVACNYGQFQNCGEGVCVGPVDKCPVPEKTQPDGTWQPCCQNGKITTCFCPTGLACNYGQFQTCQNGSCVFPGQSCP